MSKPNKKPDLRLRVLYVTPARSRVLHLSPKGNRISLEGGESAKCTRANLFPKGSPFDAIWIQGQSECLPVDRAQPVSSYEFDAAAETDYLRQVNTLAKGAKTPKASWWSLGLQVAILLGLVVLGVVLSGGQDDLQALLHQWFGSGAGGGQDTTTYRPGS